MVPGASAEVRQIGTADVDDSDVQDVAFAMRAGLRARLHALIVSIRRSGGVA